VYCSGFKYNTDGLIKKCDPFLHKKGIPGANFLPPASPLNMDCTIHYPFMQVQYANDVFRGLEASHQNAKKKHLDGLSIRL